ncbi:hypothetical protein [Arthrobacter sp. B1I2]|uniref:hypothetical protein n=1 Tax=Arthrobacter sp. B1I2 TaxID=3042263 RepID=UPI00278271CD|nr:hypothetical protein [Arthrobacter sp. B1I2]MDQ0730294.1 hypothetical protein [Arthrobacter sp. B1I2]
MPIRTTAIKVGAGAAVFAGLFALASPAVATVTFDPATGAGFVGKGDVQLVYGWNNKALQDKAGAVDFRVNSSSETSWTCTKVVVQGNDETRDVVQQRNSSITFQGLVTTVARDNSKGKDGPVTGFYLQGYENGATVETSGPAVGSCPADPSGFVYDDNAVTTGSGGGLEVSADGTTWYHIG